MPRIEQRFKAMGGPARICIDHPDQALADAAVSAAVAEIQRLECKYSRYRSDSLLTAINNSAGRTAVAIDAETAGLFNYVDTLWRESEGMFDATAGVLRQAWNFKSGTLPSQQAIDVLLGRIGWKQVRWNETEVYLPLIGMELDLGGCVKEYAADAAVASLHKNGIGHALVDLAGDIATCGPQENGRPWPIGIRDPGHRFSALATLALAGQSLASSGDYERYMEVDGQRYAHILDPRTGWPVSGMRAVSVCAGQCLVAGSAATLAMLRSEEEALDWLGQLDLPWVAMDRRGAVHSSTSG